MTTPTTTTDAAKKRTTNPELSTMAKIDRLLSSLPDDTARARVVMWLLSQHVGSQSRITLAGKPAELFHPNQ